MTLPWTGGTLSVDVTPAPTAIAILAMGFSDTAYGTTQLPLDLTNFGMPSCQLRVAPDATLLGVGANGAVSVQLGIPNMFSLVGTMFWQEALTLAPGANPAGLLTSDSRRGVVGLPR